jgi:hypothetical protein
MIWGFHGGEDDDVLLGFWRCVYALKIDTVCFSETLASTYKSTRRHNPEEQH